MLKLLHYYKQKKGFNMSTLVGKAAPDFNSSAVLSNGKICENFNLYKNIENKYGLLFFYPLDFTFVCPSELISLNNKISQFKNKNVEVIGISVDSQFSHNAWRNTPIEKGGIGNINYSLVSDLNHNIVKSYGVEHHEASVAFRAVFIIDKNKTVRIQHINDLPIGRNIDELIRLIDAIQFHEKNGEVCPVNWSQGKEGMEASSEGVIKYLNKNKDKI